MLKDITSDERKRCVEMHNECILYSGKAFNRYMTSRFMCGDFPHESEPVYMILVPETIFEDVMQLDKAISSNHDGTALFESIVFNRLKFSSRQFATVSVIPVVYKPEIGDIVTLPTHILLQVAREHHEFNNDNFWSMEIADILMPKTLTYTWTCNEKDHENELLPNNVLLNMPMFKLKPAGLNVEPIEVPLPMFNYILLSPRKEKEKC